MQRSDSALASHSFQSNDIEKTQYTCSQCPYQTNRRNNLKRHFRTMHESNGTTLECCGIHFTNKASLRHHNSTVHRDGYRCPTCSRTFCRRALLRRHQTVHSGIKEFSCRYCTYATSHKSNLERHLKIHKLKPVQVRPSPTGLNPILARLLRDQVPLKSSAKRSSSISPPEDEQDAGSKVPLRHSIETILASKSDCQDSSSSASDLSGSSPEGNNEDSHQATRYFVRKADTRWQGGFSLTILEEKVSTSDVVVQFGLQDTVTFNGQKDPSPESETMEPFWNYVPKKFRMSKRYQQLHCNV